MKSDEQFLKMVSQYSPERFNWIPFILGEILIAAALVLMFKRIRSGN